MSCGIDFLFSFYVSETRMKVIIETLLWQLEEDYSFTPILEGRNEKGETVDIPIPRESLNDLGPQSIIEVFVGGYNKLPSEASSLFKNVPQNIYYTEKNGKLFLNYEDCAPATNVVQSICKTARDRIFIGETVFEIVGISWKLHEDKELTPIYHFKGGFFSEKLRDDVSVHDGLSIGGRMLGSPTSGFVYRWNGGKLYTLPDIVIEKDGKYYLSEDCCRSFIPDNIKLNVLRTVQMFDPNAKESIYHYSLLNSSKKEENLDEDSADAMRNLVKNCSIPEDIRTKLFTHIRDRANKGFSNTVSYDYVGNCSSSLIKSVLERKGYRVINNGNSYAIYWD